MVDSPHPIKGQEIKAFIVLTPDIAATRELTDKIFTYCEAHLAPYKVPRLLEFVAELPKTISGKIRRIKLRAAKEQQQTLEATRPQELFVKRRSLRRSGGTFFRSVRQSESRLINMLFLCQAFTVSKYLNWHNDLV